MVELHDVVQVRYKQEGWTPPSPNSFPYLLACLALQQIVFVFEAYLDFRQRRRLHATEPPKLLLDTLRRVDAAAGADPGSKLEAKVLEKFHAAQQYGLAKSNFEVVGGILRHAIELTLLLAGLHPYLWDTSKRLVARAGLDPHDAVPISMGFAMLMLLVEEAVSLPFALYRVFAVEARHNFNKTTPALFAADKAKGLALTLAIGAPVLRAVLWILDHGGTWLAAYLWAFLFAFALCAITVYPVWIAPLFNKYEPLAPGELREAIEALARRVQYPLTQLYVVDGSRRSAHSNAYMYGFHKNKRIVLFDTLLKQVKQPELVAILGHELGHWDMGHVLKNFAIGQLYVIVELLGYGFVTNVVGGDLFASFGYASAEPRPPLLGMMLYLTVVMGPVDHVLTFVMNMWSRHCEFQADEYAVNLGYSRELQTGLVKLSVENLGNLNPDRLYSTYHYSHPPLVERLAAITRAAERSVKKTE